jgi:hypothetical protein
MPELMYLCALREKSAPSDLVRSTPPASKPHRCTCAWTDPVECARALKLTQLVCQCLCHSRKPPPAAAQNAEPPSNPLRFTLMKTRLTRCTCAWANPAFCAFAGKLTELVCPCPCHARKLAAPVASSKFDPSTR